MRERIKKSEREIKYGISIAVNDPSREGNSNQWTDEQRQTVAGEYITSVKIDSIDD